MLSLPHFSLQCTITVNAEVHIIKPYLGWMDANKLRVEMPKYAICVVSSYRGLCLATVFTDYISVAAVPGSTHMERNMFVFNFAYLVGRMLAI